MLSLTVGKLIDKSCIFNFIVYTYGRCGKKIIIFDGVCYNVPIRIRSLKVQSWYVSDNGCRIDICVKGGRIKCGG